MNLLKPERNLVKLRQHKREEFTPIFSRVKKRQEYCSEVDSFYAEKILNKVATYPKFGARRLSEMFILEGISLSPYMIQKCLVKHNLNLRSLRMAWKENQKTQ